MISKYNVFLITSIQIVSASSMSDALIITNYFSVYKNVDYFSAQSAVLNILYQEQIILKTAISCFSFVVFYFFGVPQSTFRQLSEMQQLVSNAVLPQC